MRSRIIVTLAIALVAVLSWSAVSAVSERTVKILGDFRFVPNTVIESNFRFEPGPLTVESGGTVTWVNADEGHTVTVVAQADLPTTLDQVFMCAACLAAISAHFPAGPPVPVVNAGSPGLDAPGDSLLLFPEQTVSATISAPAGSTLYYVCAFHPWMQGTISVQ